MRQRPAAACKLSIVNLDNYFERIGYSGSREPTLDTLAAVQRAHALAVPFENIDVQLRIPLNTSIDAAYDKIVGQGRGGWCYEQNGLFGAMLSRIGFEVTRVAAGVMLHERGEAAFGNHLCLLVRPEGDATPYLADVGFGGSLLSPLMLADGSEQQAPYTVSLKRLRDGWYRYGESTMDEALFSFDFPPEAANEQVLSDKCVDLQTSPDSSFVLNLVAQRRMPHEHWSLRGRVFKIYRAEGAEQRVLESPDELIRTLAVGFNLDVPEVGDLWPAIQHRHDEIINS